MLFLIIPYATPKFLTLFGIWFFIIKNSYTILLLINSFDFGRTFCLSYTGSLSPHISPAFLFLHGVAVSALLSLFLSLFSLRYTFFQVPDLLFPPYLSADILRCWRVS